MNAPAHPGRGRGPQRSLEEARHLASQWQASGLSKQAWCREQGILPSTLQSCMHRTNRAVISTSPALPPFVELQRRPAPAIEARMIRLSLAGSMATTELTIADLGALIQQLAEARS
jgi:hypothetical protein